MIFSFFYQCVILFTQVTNPNSDAYEVVTDADILSSAIRDETLFSVWFTSPVSQSSVQDIEISLLTSWQLDTRKEDIVLMT